MKKNLSIRICVLFLLGAGFTSCLKKIDVPVSNNATITFTNSGANFVTADVTVNPKDSIFFSYTVTSEKEMKYIAIQKNTTIATAYVARDTITTANKNSFSAVKKLVADSATGVYKYRITAYDAGNIYIGSKEVVVTVTSDFIYYSVKMLQMPDTTAKSNKCYFSTATGNTFSYTDGAANSASIDFGYFYDTTKVLAGSPVVLTEKGHTIYALNASIFTPYDLTTWTKNATQFKLTTAYTFASLTSGGALRTAGVAAIGSSPATRVSTTDRATASQATHLTGAVIMFKTVTGKYGAITINYTNNNKASPDSYINIDVKVQK